MQAFGRQRPKIPHHRRVLQVGLRVPLLRVDEVPELQRIPHKKHRRVVPHHVPVTLFGVELQRESTWIALRVGRPLLAADGRKARQHRRLLAGLEERRGRVLANLLAGAGKRTERARTLGVNHAFRNALAVEVRHLLEQQKIVADDRPAGPHRHRVLVVANRTPRVRCHEALAVRRAVRSVLNNLRHRYLLCLRLFCFCVFPSFPFPAFSSLRLFRLCAFNCSTDTPRTSQSRPRRTAPPKTRPAASSVPLAVPTPSRPRR